MKKLLLMFTIIISLNLFANLNDGKYEVVQKMNSSTYTMKIIVKNSKILFIDYDCIDSNGVKLSTKDSSFRSKKEKFKKHILSLKDYKEINENLLSNEYKQMLRFLIEKVKFQVKETMNYNKCGLATFIFLIMI